MPLDPQPPGGGERLREALLFLADHYKLTLDPPHDPAIWHGNMAENIAVCPVCRVNAALAALQEPDPVVTEFHDPWGDEAKDGPVPGGNERRWTLINESDYDFAPLAYDGPAIKAGERVEVIEASASRPCPDLTEALERARITLEDVSESLVPGPLSEAMCRGLADICETTLANIADAALASRPCPLTAEEIEALDLALAGYDVPCISDKRMPAYESARAKLRSLASSSKEDV